MKVRIEIDPDLVEEEVVIRCSEINFLRVAKSTILNVHHVRSILKNITGASEVEFDNSPKRVYVSRSYYKALKDRLEHRR
ncbi:MAG: LytTR family transcriptional regulator [Lachnospiraceae bacterium]|nr:LytTR family transcriptional regulator [Lachnospiraceae bacterium]